MMCGEWGEGLVCGFHFWKPILLFADVLCQNRVGLALARIWPYKTVAEDCYPIRLS